MGYIHHVSTGGLLEVPSLMSFYTFWGRQMLQMLWEFSWTRLQSQRHNNVRWILWTWFFYSVDVSGFDDTRTIWATSWVTSNERKACLSTAQGANTDIQLASAILGSCWNVWGDRPFWSIFSCDVALIDVRHMLSRVGLRFPVNGLALSDLSCGATWCQAVGADVIDASSQESIAKAVSCTYCPRITWFAQPRSGKLASTEADSGM